MQRVKRRLKGNVLLIVALCCIIPAVKSEAKGEKTASKNYVLQKLTPAQIYLVRVQLIRRDFQAAAAKLQAAINAAEKSTGATPKPSWIAAVAGVRRQVHRLGSISPVPNSLYQADQKLIGFVIGMDECLNGYKQWFYDQDESAMRIRTEPGIEMAQQSLIEFGFELRRVVGAAKTPPILSLPRKQVIPD